MILVLIITAMAIILQYRSVSNQYVVHMKLYKVAVLVKNMAADAGEIRDRLHLWVGKILWRRAWQSDKSEAI